MELDIKLKRANKVYLEGVSYRSVMTVFSYLFILTGEFSRSHCGGL